MVNTKEYNCQRVFCIGRNYVEHIEELGNERPDSPVIFSKPPTSLLPAGKNIRFPRCGEAPPLPVHTSLPMTDSTAL